MSSQSVHPRNANRLKRRFSHIKFWTFELELSRHPPLAKLATSEDETDCQFVSCLEGPAVIGRSPTADLHVKDKWVSRRQCAIQLSDEGFSIRDLESRHGTYVNDERFGHARLRHGDVIQIGLTTLKVSYRD